LPNWNASAASFPRDPPRPEDGEEVTVWCSNDYLGMGQHPAVVQAWSTPCRPAAPARGHAQHLGHQPPPPELEAELADLHGKEGALLFTSGYVSNWAALARWARASRTR
jgi:5-aminolevulinate synthase